MLRRSLRAGLLRQAALELGRLPEMAEASRLCAAFDFAGALRQLERTVEVIEHVPEPAMQLVAQGAVAQVLRAAGLASREQQVWDNLLTLDGAPELRLHVLSGAACFSLHQGDTEAALTRCDEADVYASSDSAVTFAVHRSLALALGRTPDAAVNTLEHALEEVHSDSVSTSALLLLGDALASSGRESEAVACWESALDEEFPVPRDGALADEGEGGAEEGGYTARQVAALGRLGRWALAQGDLDGAQQQLQTAVRCYNTRSRVWPTPKSPHALFTQLVASSPCAQPVSNPSAVSKLSWQSLRAAPRRRAPAPAPFPRRGAPAPLTANHRRYHASLHPRAVSVCYCASPLWLPCHPLLPDHLHPFRVLPSSTLALPLAPSSYISILLSLSSLLAWPSPAAHPPLTHRMFTLALVLVLPLLTPHCSSPRALLLKESRSLQKGYTARVQTSTAPSPKSSRVSLSSQ